MSESTTKATAPYQPRLYQLIRQPGPIAERIFEFTSTGPRPIADVLSKTDVSATPAGGAAQ